MSELRDILKQLIKGECTLEEAEKKLRLFNIVEIAHLAKLDVHRETRKGIPEVVLARHKSVDDLLKIVQAAIKSKPSLILSYLSSDQEQALRKKLSAKVILDVYADGSIAVVHQPKYKPPKKGGKVGIVAAGTSDRRVAESAQVMAEQMGCEVHVAYDVGVAGVHRLFPELEEMIGQGIGVLIVVAGMEGALPSLVTGLVDIPVIGLPVSTGYGLGAEGLGALISMLQSCSLGLAVVNIDNGIGAGAIAALIANRSAQK
ncbi:MAG: nickel pincer cofactor biosynthesis protein LarB [Promethearchaeota archaeon]